MTVQEGREMSQARRTPRKQQPTDPAALRRSGIGRGAAMSRAARGDREARDALDYLTAEETEPPVPAA